MSCHHIMMSWDFWPPDSTYDLTVTAQDGRQRIIESLSREQVTEKLHIVMENGGDLATSFVVRERYMERPIVLAGEFQ